MVQHGWKTVVSLWLLLICGPALAGKWDCVPEGASTRVLTFIDGIDRGENQRFEAEFVKCFPRNFLGQRVIDLFSGGGHVDEALNIARTIARVGADRPIQTRVSKGSSCISACTYLFVAGQFRDVATGGSFEPHGFSSYMGTPILQVLESAANKGIDPLKELQISRLLMWKPFLELLAQNDSRFGFALTWLQMGFEGNQPTKKGLVRMLEVLPQLTPAQQLFINQIDGVTRVAMPELERVAALHALAPAFSGGAPRADGTLPDEERYFRWIIDEYNAAARTYLRSLKDSSEPKWGDQFAVSVLTKLRSEVSETMKIIAEDLWPYISSRKDIVIEGFLRLMFSTSILYMRPLTREELCAFNIVNENCYE